MIHFPCPQCGKEIRVTDNLAGRQGSCPHCKGRIHAPEVSSKNPSPSDLYGLGIESENSTKAAERPRDEILPPRVAERATVVRKKHPRKPKGFISLADILKIPFNGELAADAVIPIIWMFFYLIAVFFVLPWIILIPFLGAIIVLASLVASIAFLALMAHAYIGVIEQFESGAEFARSTRPMLTSLGIFIAVTGISALVCSPVLIPVIVNVPMSMTWSDVLSHGVLIPIFGMLESGLVESNPFFRVILGISWYLYWPMAIAMAGAYGVFNPLKVFQKIFQTFPAYLLLIVYSGLCFVAAIVISLLVGNGLLFILPGSIGDVVGTVLAVTIIQYWYFCEFAMLGILLRKYRDFPGVSLSEFGESMKWFAIVAVPASVLIVVRLSSAWPIDTQLAQVNEDEQNDELNMETTEEQEEQPAKQVPNPPPPNRPPVLKVLSAEPKEALGTGKLLTLTLHLKADDPDGDPVRYEYRSQNEHLWVRAQDGKATIRMLFPDDRPVDFDVSARAFDAHGNVSEIVWHTWHVKPIFPKPASEKLAESRPVTPAESKDVEKTKETPKKTASAETLEQEERRTSGSEDDWFFVFRVSENYEMDRATSKMKLVEHRECAIVKGKKAAVKLQAEYRIAIRNHSKKRPPGLEDFKTREEAEKRKQAFENAGKSKK